MDVYSFAVIAYEIATGKPAFDPTLPPAKLMLAILSGKKPHIPSSVTSALRHVIKRGWGTDPKERPTMLEICEKFAAVGWCVFPDADAEQVAAAELELPIDATTSLATIALHVGKLEAENTRMKGEIAQIPALKSEISSLTSQVAEISALRSQASTLQFEKSSLKAENARLRDESAQIPALQSENSSLKSRVSTLQSENSQIPALTAQVSALQSENASIKAEIARLNSCPAQGCVIPAGTLHAEEARAMQMLAECGGWTDEVNFDAKRKMLVILAPAPEGLAGSVILQAQSAERLVVGPKCTELGGAYGLFLRKIRIIDVRQAPATLKVAPKAFVGMSIEEILVPGFFTDAYDFCASFIDAFDFCASPWGVTFEPGDSWKKALGPRRKARLRGLRGAVPVEGFDWRDFPRLRDIAEVEWTDLPKVPDRVKATLALASLPSKLTKIEEGAFDGCTALTLTALPDGIQTIGRFAFGGCASLRLTALPPGLREVGDGAFGGCDSLTIASWPAGLKGLRPDPDDRVSCRKSGDSYGSPSVHTSLRGNSSSCGNPCGSRSGPSGKTSSEATSPPTTDDWKLAAIAASAQLRHPRGGYPNAIRMHPNGDPTCKCSNFEITC
jgi:cell division protein FtsB